MNIFKIVLFLIFVNLSKANAQLEPKTIFEIRIIKSNDDDLKNRKFIVIDSLGNILSFNKVTGDKVDLKKLNKSLIQFVKKNPGVEKEPANDIFAPLTVTPGKGKHHISVTTIFMEDYRNEKLKKTKTKYRWHKLSDEDKSPEFLEYLSNENKQILKKYLE